MTPPPTPEAAQLGGTPPWPLLRYCYQVPPHLEDGVTKTQNPPPGQHPGFLGSQLCGSLHSLSFIFTPGLSIVRKEIHISTPRGSTATIALTLFPLPPPILPPVLVPLGSPYPEQRKDEHPPTPAPGAPPGAHLTLTGWLAPSHTGPRHLLSAVQNTPAAALGQVTLLRGKAAVLCPAGWGVAWASSSGEDSTLERFTEAWALIQRPARWAWPLSLPQPLPPPTCQPPAGNPT